jgi:hypothetical protein
MKAAGEVAAKAAKASPKSIILPDPRNREICAQKPSRVSAVCTQPAIAVTSSAGFAQLQQRPQFRHFSDVPWVELLNKYQILTMSWVIFLLQNLGYFSTTMCR